MPKIQYREFKFSAATLNIIAKAIEIIDEYEEAGFDLTLRQLYYQFVARGLLENTVRNYQRLGGIINDARLAGMIDWDRITDRTRGIERLSSWDSPKDIVAACANQFRIDMWANQEYRVEVWIEKEALAGVFERVCHELRIPYLSCRGYTSQSEMWRAGQRILGYMEEGKKPAILHFGDHDPSGIDMSRDIVDRLEMFSPGAAFNRLALNMDQVTAHRPPPNPAKTTDSRFEGYIKRFGAESWELDALDPTILADLVRTEVLRLRDDDVWDEDLEREAEYCRLLRVVSEQWEKITRKL